MKDNLVLLAFLPETKTGIKVRQVKGFQVISFTCLFSTLNKSQDFYYKLCLGNFSFKIYKFLYKQLF